MDGPQGSAPDSRAALFLSFPTAWADRRQVAAEEGDDAPDWIGGMATEWWGTLDEAERQSLRLEVGERIELDDGEGWYRSEASMARDAFDRRWRRQHCPPGEMKLPPQLLARAAGTDAEVIEAGWRAWIVGQPSWMQDMLMTSVMSYVRQLAGNGQHTSD